jgi:hypothetical protein
LEILSPRTNDPDPPETFLRDVVDSRIVMASTTFTSCSFLEPNPQCAILAYARPDATETFDGDFFDRDTYLTPIMSNVLIHTSGEDCPLCGPVDLIQGQSWHGFPLSIETVPWQVNPPGGPVDVLVPMGSFASLEPTQWTTGEVVFYDFNDVDETAIESSGRVTLDPVERDLGWLAGEELIDSVAYSLRFAIQDEEIAGVWHHHWEDSSTSDASEGDASGNALECTHAQEDFHFSLMSPGLIPASHALVVDHWCVPGIEEPIRTDPRSLMERHLQSDLARIALPPGADEQDYLVAWVAREDETTPMPPTAMARRITCQVELLGQNP